MDVLFLTVAVMLVAFPLIIIVLLKPAKKVELLRPRDGRGQSLEVDKETDLGLICKRRDGLVHRFIKEGRSWVFHEGGRMVTKFYALEGNAYTGVVIIPEEPAHVPLSKYLRFLWGDKFYNSIPDKQRRIIDSDLVGVTVDVKPVDVEKLGLPNVSPSDVLDMEDERMLSKLSKMISQGSTSTGRNMMMYILVFTLGFFISYYVFTRGG